MPNERKDDRTLSRDELLQREERIGRQREQGGQPDIDRVRGAAGKDTPEAADRGRQDDEQQKHRSSDPGEEGQSPSDIVSPPENDEDFNVPGRGQEGPH
jgi:hypothetical protein